MSEAFRRLRRHFGISLILALPLTASAVVAQVPQARTIPVEEQVKQEMEQSRFRLGPLRLLPRFSLTNAGYDSNLFGTPAPTVSDWTANVSLGLHFLLPLGSKMYLRADALPEYDWYAHHVDKRTFGGHYGGSWLGFFNHLTSDLSAGSFKTVSRFSSENETFATSKVINGSAAAEVNLARQWWILVGAQGDQVRYSSEGLTDVQRLDRDDLAGRAGIRYRRTSFLSLAGEIEETQTSFDRAVEAQRRDNRTTAYLLSAYYNRERLFVNLSGGLRVGRPDNGSEFFRFSTGTGSYFVSYFLTQPIEVQIFGHRQPQYSLTSSNAYYIETRNGGGVTVRVGYRFSVHAFGQYGTNDYPIRVATPSGLVDRTDRFSIVSGGLSTLFFRGATVTALVTRSNVSSNVPGAARSIVRFTTDLTLEGKAP